MFNRLTAVASVIVVLVSIGAYFFKSEKLTIDVENQEVAIEVAKDEAQAEMLETKWETIAQEHNKSTVKDKHEIKEPVVSSEFNSTDFFFFRMPTKD